MSAGSSRLVAVKICCATDDTASSHAVVAVSSFILRTLWLSMAAARRQHTAMISCPKLSPSRPLYW